MFIQFYTGLLSTLSQHEINSDEDLLESSWWSQRDNDFFFLFLKFLFFFTVGYVLFTRSTVSRFLSSSSTLAFTSSPFASTQHRITNYATSSTPSSFVRPVVVVVVVWREVAGAVQKPSRSFNEILKIRHRLFSSSFILSFVFTVYLSLTQSASLPFAIDILSLFHCLEVSRSFSLFSLESSHVVRVS